MFFGTLCVLVQSWTFGLSLYWSSNRKIFLDYYGGSSSMSFLSTPDQAAIGILVGSLVGKKLQSCSTETCSTKSENIGHRKLFTGDRRMVPIK